MRKPPACFIAEYRPDLWTPDQAQAHVADDLDVAMHQASCLAGGWYRRPVTIDMQTYDLGYVEVFEDANGHTHMCSHGERYQMRPSDAPCPDGWRPVYQVAAYNDDGTIRS